MASAALLLDEVRMRARAHSPKKSVLTLSGNWVGPGHGLCVPDTKDVPLAIGVLNEDKRTCRAVLVVPALENATLIEEGFYSVTPAQYVVCWAAPVLRALTSSSSLSPGSAPLAPAPPFSITWSVERVRALQGFASIEDELEPWILSYADALRALPSARVREFPLFGDQRMRDTTLAFYLGFVVPGMTLDQRHAWLQAERRLALLFLPFAAAPPRVPTLHQWLVTAGEMMEGAPAQDVPMADHLLLAADHALALAAALPTPPVPAVPHNLVALVTRLRQLPPLPTLVQYAPATGKARAPRLVHDGPAPADMEDLLKHAPPCIRKMLDAPHQKDESRRIMAQFLAGVGYRDTADIPRLSAFVMRDGKGDSKHAFDGKLSEAMQEGGRWERKCETMHLNQKLRYECGNGASICPYEGDGARCGHTADFEEGRVRKPSDFVHLSRRRATGKK